MKKIGVRIAICLYFFMPNAFAQKSFLNLENQIIAKVESCQKYIGTCDFYLCQEQKNPCGIDGYNLGYGFKYCNESKFKLLPQMTTVAGQKWVNEAFQCLQKHSLMTSEQKQNLSCQKIQSMAFDSHADCYAQAGFCDLSFSDKLKIFDTIKSEIFSIDNLLRAHILLQKCHLHDASLPSWLI
jgi:hypothetical protein